MKTVTERVDIKRYRGEEFERYFGDLSVGIFDIETTGLSPANAKLILSGFVVFDGEGVLVKQYFAERLEDEEEILEKTFEELSLLDVAITFNGKRFDFPFIYERARKLRGFQAYTLREFYNFDVYRIINKYSNLRSILPNLKQKTVERFMGLGTERTDEISGEESVALYYEYLNSTGEKRDMLEKFILLHNRDDVCQLASILPVLERVELDRALAGYGFPAGDKIVREVAQSGNMLRLRVALHKGEFEHYLSYPREGADYLLRVDGEAGELFAEIPLRKEQGYYFIDLRRCFSGDEGLLGAFGSIAGVYKGFLPLGKGRVTDFKAANDFARAFAEAAESLISFD